MFNRKKTFKLEHDNGDPNKSAKHSRFSVYKGLLLAVLSGVFFLMTGVIVKYMKNIYPGQLVLYRFIAIFALSLPEAVKCEENILGPKNLRFLLIIRGVIGASNLFLGFLAFRYLPLGEASVITKSAPVFVTVAARIFLKEPCGIFQSVTVFMSVIGIIFTTKAPLKLSGNPIIYTKEYIYGLFAALGSLVFSTARFIVVRKVKSVHHSLILFNSAGVAILETAILTAIIGDFQWHYCSQGLYIIILGVVSFVGQTLLTMALQCELAGPVSTMSAASHIFLAFVCQTLIFQEIPDLFSSIGGVLVGISVICVGLKKWISSLPKDARYRQKLGWMLK